MSYYAVRYISAPDQVRIEKATGPQAAFVLAFGVLTKETQWEWKDLGTRPSKIGTSKKRLALLNDPNGWKKEGRIT